MSSPPRIVLSINFMMLSCPLVDLLIEFETFWRRTDKQADSEKKHSRLLGDAR